MLGIPWILLYGIGSFCTMHWLALAAAAFGGSVPSIVYSAYMEKKYQAKLIEGGEQ